MENLDLEVIWHHPAVARGPPRFERRTHKPHLMMGECQDHIVRAVWHPIGTQPLWGNTARHTHLPPLSPQGLRTFCCSYCNIPYLAPLVKARSSLLSQQSQHFFRETLLSSLGLGFLILVTVIFRQTCLQMLMGSFLLSPQRA